MRPQSVICALLVSTVALGCSGDSNSVERSESEPAAGDVQKGSRETEVARERDELHVAAEHDSPVAPQTAEPNDRIDDQEPTRSIVPPSATRESNDADPFADWEDDSAVDPTTEGQLAATPPPTIPQVLSPALTLPAGATYRAIISPDGHNVVTVMRGLGLRVWETTADRPKTLPLPFGTLVTSSGSVAYAPAGDRLIVGAGVVQRGGPGNKIFVLDATSGQVLGSIDHPTDIFFLAVSADGRRVATASKGGNVYLWDLENRKLLRVLEIDGPRVDSLTISPDGKTVASSHGKRMVKAFTYERGRVKKTEVTPEENTSGCECIKFSPDGRYLAVPTSGGVELVAMRDGVESVTLHNDGVIVKSSVAFSPDGKLLAASTQPRSGNDAVVFEVPTGNLFAFLRSDAGIIDEIDFGGNGTLVTRFRGFDRRSEAGCHVWRLAKEKPPAADVVPAEVLREPQDEFRVRNTNDQPNAENVEFGQDGKTLVVDFPNFAWVMDLTTGTWSDEVIHGIMSANRKVRAQVNSVGVGLARRVEPDGRFQSDQQGADYAVRFPDRVKQAGLVPNHPRQGRMRGMFSPDENAFATFSPTGWTMLVRRGEKPEGVELKTRSLTLTFHPQTGDLLTASNQGGLDLWDARTGQHEKRFTGPRGKVSELRYSPDGRWLATWGTGGLEVWDAVSGEPAGKLKAFPHRLINDMEWSSDCRFLAFAMNDSRAEIWDVTNDRLFVAATGHDGKVSSVAFSPDSTKLATACDDGLVRIWELPAALSSRLEKRDELNGEWQVTKMTVAGTNQPTPINDRYTFRAGTVTIRTAGNPPQKLSYQFDGARSPKMLDMTYVADDQPQLSKMLYDINGETLTICYPPPGQPRPNELSSTKENKNSLITFKRVSGQPNLTQPN